MQKYYDLTDKLWRELCAIPAPSHHEEKRAEYIKNVLASWGISSEIDGAKNVIVKIDGKSPEIVLFEAHTDTVFPDMESLPFSEDEKNVYCPACGDDTVAVAQLMAATKYIKDSGKTPKYTLLIVFNACEEGLGNLKGTRTLLERFGKNVVAFFIFDGIYTELANVSVGSHRYKVTVMAEGGHSYSRFGNKNAIDIISRGISKIYDIKVPENGIKTTYNVGTISGGTSVNTIAQKAEMLCEYRSESYDNLMYMKEKFEEIFDYMKTLGGEVTIELVGDRPCMRDVDSEKMRELTEIGKSIQKKYTGCEIEEISESTDCNIPHFMGIPAVCIGTYMGGGAHTREEWLEKASVPVGFDIVRDILLNYFD
ncbi:MAG: M20/M25/M40 family metallo-hydrolase [Clostridia bacterium]|nr:M20/M25/M40 family metallo-hydrolase [Clostridia bacterium]